MSMMPGVLYLVPTPIGNIEDISFRCVKTLERADFIAAEHKSVTEQLLKRLSISKPVLACYGRGVEKRGREILSRIMKGESCALVCDAGTPAISDPGEYIVRLCSKAGIDIVSLPGPCAAIAALAASGLGTGRFVFEGFLSRSRLRRLRRLSELRDEKRTMVFYEAPKKLKFTLGDMLDCWGDRNAVLLKDMTKPGEDRQVTTLAEAARFYDKNPAAGEFVLVIEGAASETCTDVK
jgi:16S rRNA (cytidine1402-2'-O)-methyltransferase